MKSSNYVSLHYQMIPVDGSTNLYIDQIYNLVSKLKWAKDSFKNNPFVRNSTCDIKLYTLRSREFYVYIKSKEMDDTNGNLTKAVTLFINNAGIPNLVGAGSNYDVVQEIIKYQGKTLKRRFPDFLEGKYVVDLEDKINNSEEIFSEV